MCNDPLAHASFKSAHLPHLQTLLNTLTPQAPVVSPPESLCMPHERAWASALGLGGFSDGCAPWAALARLRCGLPTDGAWATLTPCHWDVQVDDVTMLDPQSLQLSGSDLGELHCAMQPYFAEDGIELSEGPNGTWLARGEVFSQLATASVDRVIGQSVSAWLPGGDAAKLLRRLQGEMQMLLYTHAVNDRRQAKGLQSVNSFWISETGRLPPLFCAPTAPPPTLANDLRVSAIAHDWAAWKNTWLGLDAGPIAQLAERRKQGDSIEITLCGQRGSQNFQMTKQSPFSAVRGYFRRVFGTLSNIHGICLL